MEHRTLSPERDREEDRVSLQNRGEGTEGRGDDLVKIYEIDTKNLYIKPRRNTVCRLSQGKAV